MRKTSKALAMLAVLPLAFALHGCGGEDSKVRVTPPSQDHVLYQPGTHPRFDPGGSDLPFNNDLIFLTPAGRAAEGLPFDGTADVGAASDPVRAALNALDGFSTNAPFDILIRGSVDPATVLANVNVFLVRLQTKPGGEQLDPSDLLMPPDGSPIADAADQPSFAVRVMSLDGGTNNAIRITPSAPLAPKTKYLVFLNNALSPILDTDGNPITPSWAYNALTGSSFNATGSLANVRQLINGWEQLAGFFLQAVSSGAVTPELANENMTLSYTFTTTDPETTLLAMAAPRSTLAGLVMAGGADPVTAVATVQNPQLQSLLSTPQARPVAVSDLTGIDAAGLSGGALPQGIMSLYTGHISMPYYQYAPSGTGDYAFLNENWRPNIALASALGQTVPPDVDGSFNVTYRFPFAAATTTETMPLQVTLPNPAVQFAGQTCANIRDVDGYPVAIYVHGITSDRSAVLALAHTLASRCIATVAIDQPLHGIPSTSSFADVLNIERGMFAPLYAAAQPRERHFEVVQGPTGQPQPMAFPGGVLDASGAWFINLAQLQNTRDNLRQSVMDLLNLNASLGAISALDIAGNGTLNLDNVQLIGTSLGGVVATVFASVNEQAMDRDASLAPAGLPPTTLNRLKGVVVSVGGAQMTQVLVNSLQLRQRIIPGLAAAGIEEGTTNFERFLYAAQSTIDSGDPVNYAASLAAAGVPVLLQQVNGDNVIPNEVANAPLAGTAGLALLSGADQLGAGQHNITAIPGIVKMTEGGHSSLLRPEVNPAATPEMQAQVVSFVLSLGAQVAVGSSAPQLIEAP